VGADVRERAELHLGATLDEAELRIRLVRDVAPNKRMLCITFRVPERVAFPCGSREAKQGANNDDEIRVKRAKLNS
jgi:hypothetical protein